MPRLAMLPKSGPEDRDTLGLGIEPHSLTTVSIALQPRPRPTEISIFIRAHVGCPRNTEHNIRYIIAHIKIMNGFPPKRSQVLLTSASAELHRYCEVPTSS